MCYGSRIERERSEPVLPVEPVETVEERFLIWLDSLGIQPSEVTPLPGDVSSRRYFRIHRAEREPAILAVYPNTANTANSASSVNPEGSACARFLETTRLFEAAGIRIPRILASNARAGLMLVEDLGEVSVFDLSDGSWSDLCPHIEAAIETLALLAARPAAEFTRINPLLDAQRLTDELRDAQRVFLGSSDFSGEEPERASLYTALDKLSRALASDPLVPSHRDFMSRNLMLLSDGSGAAVIDHQDACLAPRFYDLASLLNDSLFLSPSHEEQLLGRVTADQELLMSYRRCAVQRTLKATATYVKFALRGFDRHLALIAPTLARTAFQLERLPEGESVPSSIFSRWRDRESIAEGIERLLRASQRGSRA